MGRGFFNPASRLAARVLTFDDERVDEEFFARRIRNAWDYRARIGLQDSSCRVVYAEADSLPSLTLDKYEDILVIQTPTMGMDRWKDTIVRLSLDLLRPRGVYERNDIPYREVEGLQPVKGPLSGVFSPQIWISENGIKFFVDVDHGQKTGHFLDQRENHRAIAPWCRGARVLDAFCYTGGFAIHAAVYGASAVVALDESEKALNIAAENARANGVDGIIRFERANVFDRLRELESSGEKFDVIILDPPAFARSRSGVEGALRGYKEINLQAMKLLSDGGILVTCSCSYNVTQGLFMEMLVDAASDAGRHPRVIEVRTQARDHPILLNVPETYYLKCVILAVV